MKSVFARMFLVLVVVASIASAATLPITLNFAPQSTASLLRAGGTNNQTLSFAKSGTYDMAFSTGGALGDDFGGSNLKLIVNEPSSGGFVLNAPIGTNYATFDTSNSSKYLGSLEITNPTDGGYLNLGLQLVDVSFAFGNLVINGYSTPNFSGTNAPTFGSKPDLNLVLATLASEAGKQVSSIKFQLTYNFGNTVTTLQQALNTMNTVGGVPYTASIYVAPEPSFYGLLAAGMGGLLVFSRRRRQSAK